MVLEGVDCCRTIEMDIYLLKAVNVPWARKLFGAIMDLLGVIRSTLCVNTYFCSSFVRSFVLSFPWMDDTLSSSFLSIPEFIIRNTRYSTFVLPFSDFPNGKASFRKRQVTPE